MSYHHKNWLYEEYLKLFLIITEGKATEIEKGFLKVYFDPYKDGRAKFIYYEAVFRLKRGWPKFAVLYFIKRSFRQDFKAYEELKLPVICHKIFAEKMLFDAVKFYCKISD